MKIEKVIEELVEFQKRYPGIDVNVFDHRKNLGDDFGDGSSEGIYSDFNIEVYELENEEAEAYKEQHNKDFVPWVMISFDNDDYNDDCKLIETICDPCPKCKSDHTRLHGDSPTECLDCGNVFIGK